LSLLKKAYYNRKPVTNPRKTKEGSTQETNSTAEGHDTQLKIEMSAKKPNIKKIKALLTPSLAHRRKFIEKITGKGAVKKILDEYPGFKKYDQLMIEVQLVTKCKTYEQAWQKILPQLWKYTMANNADCLAQTPEDLEGFDYGTFSLTII